jgi:hypothetical protein
MFFREKQTKRLKTSHKQIFKVNHDPVLFLLGTLHIQQIKNPCAKFEFRAINFQIDIVPNWKFSHNFFSFSIVLFIGGQKKKKLYIKAYNRTQIFISFQSEQQQPTNQPTSESK